MKIFLKKRIIKAFYEAETDHILQYKPLNTGANVAREIEAKNNKYNHKDGTIANYIRPYIKARYEVNDKVWCKVNYDFYLKQTLLVSYKRKIIYS